MLKLKCIFSNISLNMFVANNVTNINAMTFMNCHSHPIKVLQRVLKAQVQQISQNWYSRRSWWKVLWPLEFELKYDEANAE